MRLAPARGVSAMSVTPDSAAVEAAHELRSRIAEYLPAEHIHLWDHGTAQHVGVFCPPGGYGIPADTRDGIDAAFTESIGMSALSDSHHLHRDGRDHVLIFRVYGFETDETTDDRS